MWEHAQLLLVISAWVTFSLSTILTNKYILTDLDGDPAVLSQVQIVFTAGLGTLWMYARSLLGFSKSPSSKILADPQVRWFRTMLILGTLRFLSILCSVISLKYVAVSFSETIKSTAPLFTVAVAHVLLGQKFNMFVIMSLVPVVTGLALATANEVGFHFVGFWAAVLNNLMDCVQNVYSKKLLTGKNQYSPQELQLYTSIMASLVQLPLWVYLDPVEQYQNMDQFLMKMLILNGVLFYIHGLSAYLLMALIPPLTFSVCSTAKRAFLIWLSVLLFQNPVGQMTFVGTALIIVGVLMYHRFSLKDETSDSKSILIPSCSVLNQQKVDV